MAQVPTATKLVVSASQVYVGEPVEFTATVSSTGPAIDGGTVEFRAGSTVLGSAAVVNGKAVLSVSTLAIGRYRVRAAFSGTNDLMPSASGDNGTTPIRTIAGTGTPGFSGDGGAATSARLIYPSNLAVDGAGNVYVVDNGNNRIRKVATDGTITTVAGNGTGGFSGDGGPATSAQLNNPYSIAVDAAGTLYIGDDGNNRIRKVDLQGTITTYGGTGISGFSGDGGPATLARLRVASMAIDAAGTVYFTDQGNGYVRKITPDGIITTIAGTGTSGYSGDGGPGTSAQIRSPYGVGVDAAGNVYFAEISNHVIRKVTPQGIISTYAGTGVAGSTGDGGQATLARLSTPGGMAVDASGNVFFNQFGTNQVRKVAPDGVISTVAGTGTAGYTGDGGPSRSAQLNDTEGLAIDAAGNLYLADSSNNVVRRVDGPVTLDVIAKPTFTTGPTAAITGTPVVGGTLTATPGPAQLGSTTPAADSFTYTWAADGTTIAAATARTLDLTPAMAGKTIIVTVTAVRDGYVDAADTSDPTAAVAKAAFATGPNAMITGTPVVGGTLTASPGPAQLGTTTPSAESFTYTWSADGTPIADATARTLDLTPAMVGKTITVTVTAVRDGYTDATDTSEPTEAVTGAVFTTAPAVALSGNAVVDAVLKAVVSAPSPAADTYAYSWFADGSPVVAADRDQLVLSPDLVGKQITLKVTASRDGYVDITASSAATATVAPASFATAPSAAISGTARVGQVLTATTGPTTPAATTYRFAWFADDTPIAAATGESLLLTPAHRGQRISVMVVATRPGYTDASTRSSSTAAVATNQAPSVELSIQVPNGSREAALTPDGEPTIRRGRTATVSWTSQGDATLRATGALQKLLSDAYGTAPIPANGSIKVRLDRAGLHTFRMIASNELGSTSASTSVVAVRAPAQLTVQAPSRATPGKTIRLRVDGLGFGERYVVTVAGQRLSRTDVRADASTLVLRVKLPRTLEPGEARIRVTGRSTQRTGTATVRIG
ncbi:Ig-like domain (group 3) [Nocardioides exalbidus]|uniref:Ig-like domain (Group 3) n=1 Tax=Nocardioides exalbidus TaxID=402596 RepID=A0A1H4Y4X3_9ACTN|nr:Ig-like domain repeat protein [Nocardioides exalbidus]SED12939.1 Ig-like domain (group 3) [Nocardioides exalbidus]